MRAPLVAVAILACFAQVTSAQLTRAVRPGQDEGPTRVDISIVVVEVSSIDDAEERFEIDFVLEAYWHDPRLRWDATDDPEASVRLYERDQIWSPRLAVVNETNLSPRLPDVFQVEPDGSVGYVQRLQGPMRSAFELRSFPVDHQRLPIQIVTGNYSPAEVELVVDRGRLALLEAGLAGWELEMSEPRVGTLEVAQLGREMAQVTFSLEATRKPGYFIWTMMVPLTLIVFMAWMVFWIDPTLLPTQVGLSTAAIFSLMAYRTALRVTLPRVSYLTKADVFILGSTLIVFFALAHAVASGRIARAGRETLARRMDSVGRWVYVLVFATVIAMSLNW